MGFLIVVWHYLYIIVINILRVFFWLNVLLLIILEHGIYFWTKNLFYFKKNIIR
jgi:hypothetical protein